MPSANHFADEFVLDEGRNKYDPTLALAMKLACVPGTAVEHLFYLDEALEP